MMKNSGFVLIALLTTAAPARAELEAVTCGDFARYVAHEGRRSPTCVGLYGSRFDRLPSVPKDGEQGYRALYALYCRGPVASERTPVRGTNRFVEKGDNLPREVNLPSSRYFPIWSWDRLSDPAKAKVEALQQDLMETASRYEDRLLSAKEKDRPGIQRGFEAEFEQKLESARETYWESLLDDTLSSDRCLKHFAPSLCPRGESGTPGEEGKGIADAQDEQKRLNACLIGWKSKSLDERLQIVSGIQLKVSAIGAAPDQRSHPQQGNGGLKPVSEGTGSAGQDFDATSKTSQPAP